MNAHELQDSRGRYVAVGDVVAGKYLVERILGAGGMAFVLSARHIDLDESFALKFLNQELLSEGVVVERFMREARAACKIRSEHVARVHDVGTHEGAPFIVMEHLVGRDLATVVEEEGGLRLEDAVEYVLQTCEALAAAHALGIVHRDIKPENLFLVERDGVPSVKLLDFGISKTGLARGDASSRLTGSLSLGTPCYMSPEQIRASASADARSDIWSLGVVLYELLTGTQAFQAETVTEMCAAVLESEPAPVTRLRPEVPSGLAAVVARAMEKDAARRFSDVGELATALFPFASSHARMAAERSSMRMRLAGGAPDSSGRFVASYTPTSWTPTSELPQLEVVAAEDGPAPPSPPGKVRARGPWAIAAAALVAIGLAGARSVGTNPRVEGTGAKGAATIVAVEPERSPAPSAIASPSVGAEASPSHAGAASVSASPAAPIVVRRAPAASARSVPSGPRAAASDAGAVPAPPAPASSPSAVASSPPRVDLGY